MTEEKGPEKREPFGLTDSSVDSYCLQEASLNGKANTFILKVLTGFTRQTPNNRPQISQGNTYPAISPAPESFLNHANRPASKLGESETVYSQDNVTGTD